MNTATDPKDSSPWLVCQLGAREHYAIPAALNERGLLQTLFTDAWLSPGKPVSALIGSILPRLNERYEGKLVKAHVVDYTASLIAFEVRKKMTGRTDGWEHIMARNEWFQDKVLSRLKAELRAGRNGEKPIVFCYSYAAKRIFEYAKSQGCKTVLGQIDPGPIEEEVVAGAVARHPELNPRWDRVPARYWDDWREECRLADGIVVNSEWSKRALIQTGVPEDKLAVVPLMYDTNSDKPVTVRHYPSMFDEGRPLRVLFLGALIIRKGIAAALEAARKLESSPIEFWFVGSEGVDLPEDLRQNQNIHWVGPVRRGETSRYYDDCDLFLFPSLSDGFGLTQLEAMSRGLPVIASNHCGEAVVDGENGAVLAEADGEHIAEVLLGCLADPGKLQGWSANALEQAQKFGATVIMPRFLEALRKHGDAV